MQPDLGAPGMNTYIEIISPTDAKDYFGTDGYYGNNESSQVQVKPVRSEDAENIIFGPAIVSWDGRLISTQIFVSPKLEPNSSDWESLTSEFVIPIQVLINGTALPDEFIFYVIKPADVNNSGTQLDAVIKRTPRGAMLFNSLTLGFGQELTFGMEDADSVLPGNQAYLPAFILVKESIIGNGATINASGGDASGNGGGNGGPGGGGGGGQWKDYLALLSKPKGGTNGGTGFTGGGKGGSNYWPLREGIQKETGIGTNAEGFSINGVLPPKQVSLNWEASGGGTGHPFGLSGIGCEHGDDFDPDISYPDGKFGYGGGTGAPQRIEGAGGSYATQGDAANNKFKGKIHGNKYIIPMAGGSGAASGNPQGTDNITGGGGGGGGGAIRISAQNIEGLSVKSIGGIGENTSFNGGCGSGGAVEISAKDFAQNVSVSVLGGEASGRYTGGEGYARIDRTDKSHQITFENHTNPYYEGIAIDGTNEIARGATKTINYYSPTAGSELYYRQEGDSDWTLLAVSDAGMNSQDFTIPADAAYDYFLLVLVDRNSAPDKGGEYTYTPENLMSQAGASVVEIIDGEPVLDCADLINLGDICFYDDEPVFDIDISNTGGSDLFVKIPNNPFENSNPNFELIYPAATGTITIPAGETRTVKVRYNIDLAGKLDNISEVFYFNHTDVTKERPWRVELRIDNIFLSEMIIQNSNNDFGTVPVGQTETLDLVYENVGNTDININTLPQINAPFNVVAPTVPVIPATILPGGTLRVTVEFTPTAETTYTEQININFEEDHGCTVIATPEDITGGGTIIGLSYPTQEIDFDTLSWCSEAVTSPGQFVENLSKTEPVILFGAQIAGDDAAAFIIKDKTYPLTLNPDSTPGDDGSSTYFYVIFDPQTAINAGLSGKLTATLILETDLPAPDDVIEIPITAYIAESELEYPDEIDLGNVFVGYDTPATDFFNIKNNGVLDENITSVIPSDNQISITPGGGRTVSKNGGNVDYGIKLNLGSGGDYEEEVTVTIDEPCPHSFQIAVKATGLLSEPEITIPDFGTIQECTNDRLRVIHYDVQTQAPFTVIQGSEKIVNDPEGIFYISTSGMSKIAGIHDTISTTTGTKFGAQIIADASGSDFRGIYTADFQVTLYRNAETIDTTIALSVEIIEGDYEIKDEQNITITENPGIEFEKTVETQSSTKTFTFTNTEIWDIEITGFVSPSSAEFISADGQSIIGTVLKQNESVSFSIEFLPQEPGNYSDEITITYSIGECPGEITIPISGEGAKARTLYLRMPTLQDISPALDNYRIPIYLNIGEGEDPLPSYDLDTIEIAIDRNLFYLKDIIGRNGTAIRSGDVIYEGDNHIIRFAMEDVELKDEESVLAELVGATLLGEKTETDLTFKRVVLKNDGEVSDTVFTHGHLEIEICEQGGERLLKYEGEKPGLSVSPNPAQDNITVTCTVIEKGDYTVSIFNVTGINNEIDAWNKPEGGVDTKTIPFDVSSFSKGAYFVKMITPSGTEYIQKLIIQ
jgi:hypothetical protein